jgi:hypothetical protein
MTPSQVEGCAKSFRSRRSASHGIGDKSERAVGFVTRRKQIEDSAFDPCTARRQRWMDI